VIYPKSVDDPELVSAWRSGDRAAGDLLIRRHFDAILRFFRTKLGDDVEDLVQRTFMDLLEVTGSVVSVRATLFTIAKRRLVDHLRQTYVRAGAVELVTSLAVADLGTSPSGAVARNQEEQLLGEALRAIPLDYQIALELAYWEELSGPEIAEVLGIAEPTVRSRLTRAREALRDALSRLGRPKDLCISTLAAVDARLGL
jgi:RNA polymerase sigma factor (sigma-70 family)